MYLRENEYEQLCKTCPFLIREASGKTVCPFQGCMKKEELFQIIADRHFSEEDVDEVFDNPEKYSEDLRKQ